MLCRQSAYIKSDNRNIVKSITNNNQNVYKKHEFFRKNQSNSMQNLQKSKLAYNNSHNHYCIEDKKLKFFL